jgi:hypothetical protein
VRLPPKWAIVAKPGGAVSFSDQHWGPASLASLARELAEASLAPTAHLASWR